MYDVFVYGTLLSPEITKKLTGKSFTSHTAVLPGYKKYCVKDAAYPAIIPSEGSVVEGLVLENIDDLALKMISFYEGEEYEKKEVTVLYNGQNKMVLTFIWVKGIDLLEDKKWNPDWFQKFCLKNYIEKVIPATLREFREKRVDKNGN